MKEREALRYSYAGDEYSLQIIELLTLCTELAKTLLIALAREDEALLQTTYADLQAGLQAATPMFPAASEPKGSQVPAMLENAAASLDAFVQAVNEDRLDRARDMAAYELVPFLEELREDFYFWHCVAPSGDTARYYREEFALHHASSNALGEEEVALTLFMPAYNKVEYTRHCVQSILAHTDLAGLRCELLLINHGSTDETQAYFESIPGAKIMHFQKNVRMIMISTAMRAARGKYCVLVNNDAVLTKGWLDNLLRCAESSEQIFSATPVTPNTSNHQDKGARSSYSDIEQMQHFAAAFNRSDPAKWDRRARIMPVIALYRTELARKIGFADRLFSTMEFWDDDLSLRVREHGYLQVVCGDTYCHHFGSVTGRDAQVRENTLGRGRALFQKKNGMDAWGPGMCYDLLLFELVTKLAGLPAAPERANLLAVDPGMGDTAFQMGNLLRRQGQESALFVVSDEESARPLRLLADHFAPAAGDHCRAVAEAFPETGFHWIYVGGQLDRYPARDRLARALAQRLSPGGTLMFLLSSPLTALRLQRIFEESRRADQPSSWFNLFMVGRSGAARMLFSQGGQTGMLDADPAIAKRLAQLDTQGGPADEEARALLPALAYAGLYQT